MFSSIAASIAFCLLSYPPASNQYSKVFMESLTPNRYSLSSLDIFRSSRSFFSTVATLSCAAAMMSFVFFKVANALSISIWFSASRHDFKISRASWE